LLQCVAAQMSEKSSMPIPGFVWHVAVCCSVCAMFCSAFAMCCSALQHECAGDLQCPFQGSSVVCPFVLLCVAVCCCVLQCVAVRCSALQMQEYKNAHSWVRQVVLLDVFQYVVVQCRVLQLLQRECAFVLQCPFLGLSGVLQCVAVWCSVLQCVAARICLTFVILLILKLKLQRVAACCSMSQCVAVRCSA